MRLLAARAGLVAVILASAPGQQPVAPDSVGRLVDLWQLPLLTPGVSCRQFASTDPAGRGDDHGHFLRRDGDRCVLAEMDGPGVIVRLWSANAAGRLAVFCDGEAEPRLVGPFVDLFTGKLPPFVEPIAVHASGGFVSYFPIPYGKSCRVEVSDLEQPAALYYQVQYLTYPPTTPMRTFTRELPAGEQRELERVLQHWRNPGASPVAAAAGDRELRAEIKVPRGERRELFALDQAGTALTLRLQLRTPTPAALRGLCLEAAWDGGASSIAAPVGDLFGVGFGVGLGAGTTEPRGLALGWDQDGGYCHLPMPFQSSARIAVRNAGDADQELTALLRWRPGAPRAEAGALHAEFRAVDGVGRELYEIASIPGPGKYVGLTQTLQGVGDLWYLEGNEEFAVDGQTLPSIRGTGTEDFYNGGWYWDRGTTTLPLHGLGVKEEWTTNRTTPWRLQIPDAVPFAQGLVARIEHGSANQVRDAYYSSVAFWYGPPRAARPVPDAALRLPRLWVSRPRGFTGAAALRWNAEPAVEWRTWEELTPTHRGLARPLFQAFPVSYVEHEHPASDARVAVLPAGESERSYRAQITAPFADRFTLQLRVLAASVPGLALDGVALPRPAAPTPPPQSAPSPLLALELPPVALTQGEHELAFVVPGGATARFGVDSLRLLPASPYVRMFWVAPPVAGTAAGTVADELPHERAFLADGFAPATAGWKLVQSPRDSLDLNHHVSNQSPMLAYLLVFVRAKAPRTARVLLGSDDGVRVWLNGTPCWTKAIHRHLTADEDQFDVPLRAGWNRLLLKVKNDDGGYGVMLRIADPDGGLEVAGEPR